MDELKPINRSAIRILFGKLFFRCKRYIEWYTSDKKFAKNKEYDLFRYVASVHKTPLIRQLKDVDMWMQYNKVKNIQIAVKTLNCVVLKPGETLSYWKLIGKPSRIKGYVKGMNLFCGKFVSGIGGGLCQLSNLIYWITLHTSLNVVERHRHSYDVFPDSNRTQPFGSGATCVYNYRDLQIHNKTNEEYQLHIYLTKDYLCGEWRTNIEPSKKFEIYEKEHCFKHEFWGGYSRNNSIYRKIFDEYGSLIEDELIAQNHAIMMYQPFLTDNIDDC